MSAPRAFHVTERENASLILEEGFLGGWGDVGFGVYFWTDETVCRAYAKHGGWDGLMTDPVVLVVEDPGLQPINPWDIHPDWDLKPYLSMLWRPMEEDTDTPWQPQTIFLLDPAPPDEAPRP